MAKIIEKFNDGQFIYIIDTYRIDKKYYPQLSIYKENQLIAGCNCDNGIFNEFFIYTFPSIGYHNEYISNLNDIYPRLKKYIDISRIVLQKFEDIFLLLKLNNFNCG